MKYIIISSGLFITAAILYSSAYIASAVIHTIMSSIGSELITSQTQPLITLSIIAVIAAVLFLLTGLFEDKIAFNLTEKQT